MTPQFALTGTPSPVFHLVPLAVNGCLGLPLCTTYCIVLQVLSICQQLTLVIQWVLDAISSITLAQQIWALVTGPTDIAVGIIGTWHHGNHRDGSTEGNINQLPDSTSNQAQAESCQGFLLPSVELQ